MKISEWYNIYVCNECDKRISYHQKMYSSGICPHCGYDSKSTVNQTKNVVVRQITHHKWWQFWKKKYSYDAAVGFSKEWLNKNGYKTTD